MIRHLACKGQDVRIVLGLVCALTVSAAAHPPLQHFSKVADGVYKGSTPRNEAAFAMLRSYGIRTIVDIDFLPLTSRFEKSKADRYGMRFFAVKMNGSPVPPSERHVNQILAILHDKRYHPVYFHCALGRDRTSLIAALYKMYFEGYSERRAWQYMRESGFKDSWTLRGLKTYLDEHPRRPPGL